MNTPVVSVIIPVFNGDKYIEKCISSLMCQTFTAIEIIVVNDGSTDKTSNILHNMQALDSRIKVIDKENEGVSIARNTAIELARGEWIAFSDADDYYYPNGIDLLLHVAAKSGCKRILGNSERIGKDGHMSLRYPNFKKCSICTDYPKGSHEMWGDLFHVSLFGTCEYKFKPGLAYLEDRLLMAKLLSKEGKYAVCAKPVYVHVKNNDSVLESKNGIRIAKHCFWAASQMVEFSKKTNKFAEDIRKDAEQAKIRGCIYFFMQRNAEFSDLRNIFYSYFSQSNKFYKYVLFALFRMWLQVIKSRVKLIVYRK